MLRALQDKQIVIEAQITRIIISSARKKQVHQDGDDMKAVALQPGDHMLVECTRIRKAFYARECESSKSKAR